MANARLMQQTLAQFDIEVSLGDITKGPTITRYELHPAPGVKLEKISALSNNIAETPEAKALAERAAEEAVAKLYREQSEALAKTVKDIERLVRQKFSEDARPPRQ